MPSGQAEPPSAWPASPSAWPSSPCDSPAAAGPVPTADDAAVPDPVPSADDAATAAGPAEPAPASPRPAVLTDEDGEPFDAEEFFNPFSGPPEGADAWLAQVAAPVADAWLEARQPPPDGPEALAAGFTHRDQVPGARGFAAGGPLDTMEPGPVLAGFADDAIDAGLSALSDDELVGVLGAARRLASRAAGIELAAVAGLAARRAAAARVMGDWRQHEHVADEIAAALRLTCRAADKLLDLATGVTRLPAVTAALAAGRIDLPKAMVYHHELAAVADVAAAAIAAVTITDAAGLTTGQLREVLHRAVLAHDPEAAAKRRRKAEKDARVESWAEHRGTAAMGLYGVDGAAERASRGCGRTARHDGRVEAGCRAEMSCRAAVGCRAEKSCRTAASRIRPPMISWRAFSRDIPISRGQGKAAHITAGRPQQQAATVRSPFSPVPRKRGIAQPAADVPGARRLPPAAACSRPQQCPACGRS